MKYIKITIIVVFAFLATHCQQDASISKNDGTGGSLAIFSLKGDYLYAVDQRKLSVFSLENFGKPEFIRSVNVGFDIETLYNHGDYLYMGSRQGMYIFSIAVPDQPTYASSVIHVTACDPVVANETHSYVTLHSTQFCGGNVNVLEVYNTQNPLQPQLLHTENLVQPKGLGFVEDHLVVCDDVIKVFGLSNPNVPNLLGSLPNTCFDVIYVQPYLYAIGTNGLFCYEIPPLQPLNAVLKSTLSF